MSELGRDIVILHFGDHDPSGCDAADKIEASLREFAPGIEIEFRRCAVTPEQIERWRLPTRPTKKTDSRAKRWNGGESVELDAIDPNTLRALCNAHIESIIPEGWLATMRAAEESELDFLLRWGRLVAEFDRGAP
jgi:hypothetical protein